MSTIFTAWVTKYALTRGVFFTTVEDCFGDDGSQRMVKDKNVSMCYYHGREWHRTEEEAVEEAKRMQKKRIASLKKSIERIKKMEFGS